MVSKNLSNGIQMGSFVSDRSGEKEFVDYQEKQDLTHLESILHIKLVTNDLKAKPDIKKVGPFAIKSKDGRIFKFDYEHCKVLEGFETNGSYHMNFRFSDLDEDYVLKENEMFPTSWKDALEGELEEVSYKIFDESGESIRCEIDFLSLCDATGDWHMFSDEQWGRYNQKQKK